MSVALTLTYLNLVTVFAQIASKDLACLEWQEGPWCTIAQEEPFSALQLTADVTHRVSNAELLDANDDDDELSKSAEGVHKVALLVTETVATAFRSDKASSLHYLMLLFMFTVFVFVALTVYYQMFDKDKSPRQAWEGLGAWEEEQEVNTAPPAPVSSGKLYNLPGVGAKVAAPRRWPENLKKEKVQTENDYGHGHPKRQYCCGICVEPAVEENVFDHDEDKEAAHTEGAGSFVDTGAGEAHQHIDVEGHLCPFVHSQQAVTYDADGAFLANPTGFFNVNISVDSGRRVFALCVEPYAIEGLHACYQRQITLHWFQSEGAHPLVTLRHLDKSKSHKEADALAVGGKFGIWDMNGTLAGVISQSDDHNFVIKHIFKKACGKLGTKKWGTVEPVASTPVNAQDLSDIYAYDAGEHSKRAVAVLRAMRGAETGAHLTIHVYKKGDLTWSLVTLLSALILQPVDQSVIEAFALAAAPKGGDD